MTCSELNFLASQALYGRMIAHPEWDDDKLVEASITIALKLQKRVMEEEANLCPNQPQPTYEYGPLNTIPIYNPDLLCKLE